MFLVECILYGKFKYWLAKDKSRHYFWSGLLSNAAEFDDPETAENVGLAYSKVDFTIEKK